jgi:predicted class III extradiol MEMO1 family dioxygenase
MPLNNETFGATKDFDVYPPGSSTMEFDRTIINRIETNNVQSVRAIAKIGREQLARSYAFDSG